MTHRCCVLVPHYCHAEQLADYLPQLVGVGLPIIIVDDGSDPATRSRLRHLVAASADATSLIERDRNEGKGAAVIAGMDVAARRGFTHAVCVDADGQHDSAAIPLLLQESRRHPERLLSGRPVFGDDIPKARLWGREITNVLARIEAGNAGIRDAMCGLRLYPLAQVLPLCRSIGKRRRMELDTEVLVRACWAGVEVGFLPTRVVYPTGGKSHFRMVADNARLSLMHARLLAGALFRLLARPAQGRLAAKDPKGNAGDAG